MNSAQNGDSPFLKLENGENRVRIVSEIQGVKEHRIETPESCTMTACPKEMLRWQVETTGQDHTSKLPPCPICEAMEKDEKKAQNWRPRSQYLAVALIRIDGKVGVLKIGKTVFAGDPVFGHGCQIEYRRCIANGKIFIFQNGITIDDGIGLPGRPEIGFTKCCGT